MAFLVIQEDRSSIINVEVITLIKLSYKESVIGRHHYTAPDLINIILNIAITLEKKYKKNFNTSDLFSI